MRGKTVAFPFPATSATLPVWFFSVTLFLSAFLLFWLQLMVAKMVLPSLGGTPAVWNTCMVFFQALLLAGYSYTHLSMKWLGTRLQIAMHALLLLLPLCFLPIQRTPEWIPPGDVHPIAWLLGLLFRVVGLPFFVVSTTTPLLQKWFAQTRHTTSKDPYFLYAASNLGSLLALLSYPIVIEPLLRLADQSRVWAAGYTVLILLIVGCVGFLWRTRTASDPPQALHGAMSPMLRSHLMPSHEVTFIRRLRWVLLSFAPSSLMLGVTTYLSTDIAPVPLLWVIPLALYLLTFVLVFAKKRLIPHAWMIRAFPVVILPLLIVMVAHKTSPIWWLMLLHLSVLFIAAMICHGELANDRPSTSSLTEFYLWMSVGGVLGGLFNALIAPRLFDDVLEYPLILFFVSLLRPRAGEEGPPTRHWLDYALPLALGAMIAAFALAETVVPVQSDVMHILFLCVPAALACYTFRNRPVRFGLSVGAFLLVGMTFTSGWERALHMERSFFGVYRVMRLRGPGGPYHRLEHGTTLHGMQSLNPIRRREPLTYFSRTGPLGQIFDVFAGDVPRLRHVAAIGLGTGTTACYASPGQEWTFYEIDPLVLRIATNPRYFTYLRDCLEKPDIVLGDARLSLIRAPDHSYDVVILDAFSSDAIPMHLLTQEALQLYLTKLADRGLVVFHVSNRYLRLARVLGAMAEVAGLQGVEGRDLRLSEAEVMYGKSPSIWVVMARRREDLGALTTEDGRWRPLRSRAEVKAWTDDFSNILSVVRWK